MPNETSAQRENPRQAKDTAKHTEPAPPLHPDVEALLCILANAAARIERERQQQADLPPSA